MHTQIDFLCVHRTATVTAAGLLSCLESALQCLGIQTLDDHECQKIVGFGTDGASSNIGVSSGLKALLEKDMPWVYWMWYLAHRLELAVSETLH